jgi:hypothetical protein
MAMRGDPEAPPPLPPEITAFGKLVAANRKRPATGIQQKFVKKLDNIPPLVDLPAEEPCRSALNLTDQGIIGNFTGLWPSPKIVEMWVQRNWCPLVTKGIRSHIVGRGFFAFIFNNAEDRNIIFRNIPYFMGPQDLYLNKWMLDFNLTQDVPSVVPVWVRLPHMPLHCWNLKSLEAIGNALGKYIDRDKRKDRYSNMRRGRSRSWAVIHSIKGCRCLRSKNWTMNNSPANSVMDTNIFQGQEYASR